VLNRVGVDRVFGADANTAVVFGADGATTELAERPKDELADAVLDLVVPHLTDLS
jgi:phosphopantothenoylcysteine decarboxylase/phosphopantothenate--cysteine ligase